MCKQRDNEITVGTTIFDNGIAARRRSVSRAQPHVTLAAHAPTGTAIRYKPVLGATLAAQVGRHCPLRFAGPLLQSGTLIKIPIWYLYRYSVQDGAFSDVLGLYVDHKGCQPSL